jgi:hypothetical protein
MESENKEKRAKVERDRNMTWTCMTTPEQHKQQKQTHKIQQTRQGKQKQII